MPSTCQESSSTTLSAFTWGRSHVTIPAVLLSLYWCLPSWNPYLHSNLQFPASTDKTKLESFYSTIPKVQRKYFWDFQVFFSFILLFRINTVPFCPWKLRAFVDKFLIHSWSCAVCSCRFSFPATLPSAHSPPNILYLSANYSSFSPTRKDNINSKEKAYECLNN